MTTYHDVHAGDWVIGHDGDVWGVAEKVASPLSVTLVKADARMVVRPVDGATVTIVQTSDLTAEQAAWAVLAAAGMAPQVIGERWTA